MSSPRALGSSAQFGFVAAMLMMLIGVAPATSCFKYGQLYTDSPATDRVPNGQYTASPYICQTLCQRESWCDHFVWKEHADYSKGVLPHGCWLLNGVGTVTEADVIETGLIVNGPKLCPTAPEAPTSTAKAPAHVGVPSTKPVSSSPIAPAAASTTTVHSHVTEPPILVPPTIAPSNGMVGYVQSTFKGGIKAWVTMLISVTLFCTILLVCWCCLPGDRNLPSKDRSIKDIELPSKEHLSSLDSTELAEKGMPKICKPLASHVAPANQPSAPSVAGYSAMPQHLNGRGSMMAMPVLGMSDYSVIQGPSTPSMQYLDLSGYSVMIQPPTPQLSYRQPKEAPRGYQQPQEQSVGYPQPQADPQTHYTQYPHPQPREVIAAYPQLHELMGYPHSPVGNPMTMPSELAPRIVPRSEYVYVH